MRNTTVPNLPLLHLPSMLAPLLVLAAVYFAADLSEYDLFGKHSVPFGAGFMPGLSLGYLICLLKWWGSLKRDDARTPVPGGGKDS